VKNKQEHRHTQTDTVSTHDRRWVFRAGLLMAFDAAAIAFSYFFALYMRFDFVFSAIDPAYLAGYRTLVIPYMVMGIAVLWCLRLYHSIWVYVSANELARLVAAFAIFQGLVFVVYLVTQIRMPISFWVTGGLLTFLLTTGIRFSYRFARAVRNRIGQGGSAGDAEERVMLVGAGAAGIVLVREILSSPNLPYKLCCIIDDNPGKRGRYLDGIPIVGNRDDIPAMAERYGIDTIIMSIPSASGQTRKEILTICQTTSCKVLSVPGLYQLVNGQVSVTRLRPIQVEDLLGRDPVKVDTAGIADFLHGKVVLVTGGGGSIGSELCRQVAQADPKQLIIFDIYENNAYAIQMELQRKYPDLDLVTLIGSVRDERRVASVFEQYHPEVIYHAAAHKHVPLMEESPCETIKNNVMGTYRVASAALRYGARRFVLISTDKAVNPTNIMGASKRLCEMVVQMMNRRADAGLGACDTDFVAVRFGNVLGSNGSVIPLFRQQIAEGGPVTVTDRRIIRYFMTIPEAVGLVLQASCYARGGEIFVLDMGDPVKIDDMARQLIRLSGYMPDVDIKVVYTGLRPGEKLFEEMLMDEEGLKETPNKLIHIGEPIKMDDKLFMSQLHDLDAAARQEDPDIKQLVAKVVPTYRPETEDQA
jgi:FlaA1/EpsC-like NDP-sugar epimerase